MKKNQTTTQKSSQMSLAILCLLVGGLMLLGTIQPVSAQENRYQGQHPCELDWAGRYEDDHVPLIDFEKAEAWTIETSDGSATINRSNEEIIWDDYSYKNTYKADWKEHDRLIEGA